MRKGIFYAVSATAFWGLAFPLTLMLPHFSLLEIVLGRYLVYGLLSLLILIATYRRARHYHFGHVFKMGLIFAMSGNCLYYCFLLAGIRLAGAPISALFVGMLPVTIPIYGNWKRGELDFSLLLLPTALILAGLTVININDALFSYNRSLHTFHAMMLGIFSNITALALWTWFGVANANFLKNHPEISSKEWSTVIGISTLLATIFPALVLPAIFPDTFYLWSPLIRPKDVLSFICVIVVLGLGVSWYATVLWNKASAQLPVPLLGQLILFETIFGLFYIFIKETRYPTLFEITGIALALSGLLLCMKNMQASQQEYSVD